MIAIHQLGKRYAKSGVQALHDVSFEVKSGELFGLIGPDGAGKTTLFRILATLLKPDDGYAEINGLNVVTHYRDIRRSIGYMPGQFVLYKDLSVRENLEFFASVFGSSIADNYALIRPVYSQIERFEDRRAGQLSGGMKQKLALSCALVHRPSVLLLDEPTTGVDPVSRKEFWESLQTLRAEGMTILVSTPYMDEARLCDRIALIERGQILDTDAPAHIAARYDRPLLEVRGPDMFGLLHILREWEGAEACYAFGAGHHLMLREGRRESDLQAYLQERGVGQAQVSAIAPGIEDAFMRLLNQSR